MSIISEIKCARCDRKYSGVRSRCPYCGARRIGHGKFSEESDNTRGKMLIGILILSVLVVAAGVLLFTTNVPEDEDPGPAASSPTGSIAGEDETTSVTGTNPVIPDDDKPPETEEPSETPTPTVRSVMITYGGKEKNDFTAKIGESVALRVRIEPVGIEEKIMWESSDRNVFEVVSTDEMGLSAKVTGIGKGNATLTVTVGGVEDDCIVRVR